MWKNNRDIIKQRERKKLRKLCHYLILQKKIENTKFKTNKKNRSGINSEELVLNLLITLGDLSIQEDSTYMEYSSTPINVILIEDYEILLLTNKNQKLNLLENFRRNRLKNLSNLLNEQE